MPGYAKVICDSVSPDGVRLTTFEARFRRFVLAEVNTHRRLAGRNADDLLVMEEFSRNSASSRAIPFARQIQRIQADLALPVSWPAEQKGMQGGAEIKENVHQLEGRWRLAAEQAVASACRLADAGVHKSVVNRLLEPFMWHTAVLTATDLDGFWAQRVSPLAQPEIRVMAEEMKTAYDASTPQPLAEGQWHLPYIDGESITAAEKFLYGVGNTNLALLTATLVSMSAARCARVSYETQDGKRDVQADIDLYSRLVTATPPHWSPFEHQATPWPQNQRSETLEWDDFIGRRQSHTVTLPVVGNLRGWRQRRFELEADAA